ncbi:unnamed protein product [Moneuplotes crassus]|uniref:Uncharacterized protein n=1 Tax=Euplotes crassus TaxID=5936 RepID=A0AAD1XSP3_EUPCR|nr:unnamed protein product [Moneuplotes crassus]
MESVFEAENKLKQQDPSFREKMREQCQIRNLGQLINYGDGVSCGFKSSYVGGPIQVNKAVGKVKLYAPLVFLINVSIIRKNKKKISRILKKLNVKDIRDAIIVGENAYELKKFDKIIFNSLIRLIPKVYMLIRFSRIIFSKKQFEILLNNIIKLGSLDCNSCQIDTSGIQIWPNRAPMISNMEFLRCSFNRTDFSPSLDDLEDLFICISESSLKNSVKFIDIRNCGSADTQVGKLANKYNIGAFRSIPVTCGGIYMKEPKKVKRKCTIF